MDNLSLQEQINQLQLLLQDEKRKREDEAKEMKREIDLLKSEERAKEAKRQQEEVERLQQEMERQQQERKREDEAKEMKREIDLLKSEETSFDSFESLFLSFAHSPLLFLFFFFVFLTKMTQPFFLSTALLSWLFPTLCFGGHLESSVLTSLQQSIFFLFFFLWHESE